MKLHQVIALVAGKKARAQKLLTEVHHGWNEKAISGMTRTYIPKAEDGDQFPPESKQVHVQVASKIAAVVTKLAEYYDIVATQEGANTTAGAYMAVEGLTLGVLPVTVILFLERQLVDLHAFVKTLPTLPADREWSWDENRNCYSTRAIETVKTTKIPAVLVKYEATKEHPAQTETYGKDLAVGIWTTTHLSSAIPEAEKAAMLARVEVLQDAAKAAREEANDIAATETHIGHELLAYVFGTKSAV
jgi:hypothetical protein